MAKKEATKSFVLRVDAETMEAIEKWAAALGAFFRSRLLF